jgi:hypothetical protein
MISATRALQAADEGPLELESIVSVLSGQFAVATGSKRLVRRRRLDTFDGRLRAAGLTLEHRLTAVRDSGEQLVLGRPDGSTIVAVPVQDLRWPAPADALPVGPVRDAVAPVIGVRALTVASDERRYVRRLELRNEDGKTVARVELDEPASATAEPARLTVSSLRGYDGQARRADRLLVSLGLREVEHSDSVPAGFAPEPSVTDRAVDARVLLTTALSDFLAAMRTNLPGLLDDVDTEFLHATFRRLLTEWGEELAALVDTPEDTDREPLSAGRLADLTISRVYRRVARDGALIGADSPAQDLHGLRKRCKELRYALEVLAPLIVNASRKRAIADLKDLQDVLGRFQDSQVQRQALRGFAEEMMAEGTTAGAMLAMGELIGHLDVEQERARREFDVVFARFGRPSSVRLMHRMGGGL